MKNEFCTYEQSVALKELGFDEPCLANYLDSDPDTLFYNSNKFGKISAPLIQQAFRFFRENYGFYFTIEEEPGSYLYELTIRNTKDYFVKNRIGCYKTYEEAEQSCLDKIIKLASNGKWILDITKKTL